MMHSHFPDVETLIYGSEARGEAREESDIDMLILLPDTGDDKSFKNRKYEILDKIFDLEINLSVNFSPLVLKKSVWLSKTTPFTINVNRDAIKI